MVKSSAEALLRIINDILDFSKIEAGKLELEPHPFALRDAVGDTVQMLARAAPHSKGLELTCRVAPDVPDGLSRDAERLRQVLVNLVGNAIKFTERGEVCVDVDARRAAATGGRTVVLALRGPRHGHRHPEREQALVFDAVRAGRRLDVAAHVRRHRPGPGHLRAARPLMGGAIGLTSAKATAACSRSRSRWISTRRQRRRRRPASDGAARAARADRRRQRDQPPDPRRDAAQWGIRADRRGAAPTALAALDAARAGVPHARPPRRRPHAGHRRLHAASSMPRPRHEPDRRAS